MQPFVSETLDDVLSLAQLAMGQSGGRQESLRAVAGVSPELLVVGKADGTLLHTEGCVSDGRRSMAPAIIERVARQTATRDFTSFQVTAECGRRTILGMKLAGVEEPLCLAIMLSEQASPLRNEEAGHLSRLLATSLLSVALQTHQRCDELQTRIEQLHAGHETLQTSYARTLNEAIEEREERLRIQREHTQRLQAVMKTASEGIVTIDEKGLIESFNAAAASMFGYTEAEIIEQSVAMLLPSPHRDFRQTFFVRCLSRFRRTAGAAPREIIAQRKDGTIFSMELGVSEVALGDKRIYTAIFRDITERKRAERELKRLHFLNRMILDSAGEGIIGVDAEGKVNFANPAAERALGWSAREMAGGHIHQLIHAQTARGETYHWTDCPLRATLRDGSIQRMDHEVFWHRNGESFPVEFVCTPIREGGRIVGAVLTFLDITQRKLLEGQLIQAQKLESIGQLAAGIAHEINTPTQFVGDNMRFIEDAISDLTGLLEAAARLDDAAHDGCVSTDLVENTIIAARNADLEFLIEEIPKAVCQSIEGVAQVAKIVRSMKEFSHPGNDEKQWVNLNHAIESTLTVCRNEWKYVADVETHFDHELPMVRCLPGECNQVFLNLIINAAHAIADKRASNRDEAKGRITITTRATGTWVEVRIGDTGTGIPKQYRDKVFDPFFTTKEVGRGTGQGLALANSVIVDKHAGKILLETEVGQGSTFIIRLPQDDAAHRHK